MATSTRRKFLKSLGAFSISSFASIVFCKRRSNTVMTDEPLRNVLVIIGDDHAASVLRCYSNCIIRTPNLDRMAARGILFTNAFANAPLCSASRQSVLTGKYPHACGVTLLRTPFPAEQVTIAEHLKARGFKTGVIGKTHFNNDLPHGFDYRVGHRDYRKYLEKNPPRKPPEAVKTRPSWRPFKDPARIWLNAEMLPSEHYDLDTETTFYAKKAIEFLHKNKDNRFCLWVGFHEPHSPFNFPIEFAGKYHPDQMLLPEGSPEDDRWIPKVFKDLTEEDKRGIIASYYTSVEYLDTKIGLILRKLENLNLDKNTLVIYIGDQGYLLGDHKRFEKHTMWDPAIRAPLIVQAGRCFRFGRKSDVLTEFVDLTPTILDVLGVAPMKDVQGKSLMPILKEKKSEHKEVVFSEYLVDNKVMIRTQEWKYIFTSGKRDLGQGYATGFPRPGITHRLYNLKNDPGETKNLAGESKYQDILLKLQSQMLKLFKETHPKANQLPEGLSPEQTLVFFCEPPDKNADLDAK